MSNDAQYMSLNAKRPAAQLIRMTMGLEYHSKCIPSFNVGYSVVTTYSRKGTRGTILSLSYLRLSCDDEDERSDWGRDTMLSELFR